MQIKLLPILAYLIGSLDNAINASIHNPPKIKTILSKKKKYGLLLWIVNLS